MTEKNDVQHVDDPERKDDLAYSKTGNVVADNDARDYVDPNLVISDEENKAMRRKIHKRYVCPPLISGSVADQELAGSCRSCASSTSSRRSTRVRLVPPRMSILLRGVASQHGRLNAAGSWAGSTMLGLWAKTML